MPASFYKLAVPSLTTLSARASEERRLSFIEMSQMYNINDKGSLHVDEVRETIKQEIRRELKIKEGAENLRKVSTDKRTLAQCQQAIKLSTAKLEELHDHLQDLNAHISEEIIIGEKRVKLSSVFVRTVGR